MLHFQDVAIRSENGESIVENISFELHKGEALYLAGPSGIGKSTIIRSALGLEKHVYGSIMMLGQDPKQFTDVDLSINYSFIEQSAKIWNRTIRENVLFGSPISSDELILQIFEKLNFSQFRTVNHQLLDVVVGKDGSFLSGGEKQRIQIARVILQKRPVLVMDESMSELDDQTCQAAWQLINEMLPDSSILFSSHHSSPLSYLNRKINVYNVKTREQTI